MAKARDEWPLFPLRAVLNQALRSRARVEVPEWGGWRESGEPHRTSLESQLCRLWNLWCWEGLSCMAWGSLSVMTIQGACYLVWLTPHKGWDVSGSPHRKQGLKHVFRRQPSVLSLTWSSQCFHLFLHLQGLLFRIFEPKETACLSSFMSPFCLFGLFR